MPAPKVPQRVTLLQRGVRPGVELLPLLTEEHAVDLISAPLDLARVGPPPDVVVVDVPAVDRGAACEQVRHYYDGPLVVLLHPRDNSHDLPPDRNRTLLARPFSVRQLAVALAASAPVPPPPPAAGPARRPGLVRRLRERRLVRMSAILAAAALAFVAAFGLANRSDHCPPRCNALTAADDLTSSSGTTVPAVGVDPETIDSGAGVAGPTRTDPSGSSTAAGASQTEVAVGGPRRGSTTTSRSSGAAPTPTSAPDPTRPPPSASPTSAPTTTGPRPTTTTTTTSSTTTTATTLTGPSTSGRRR